MSGQGWFALLSVLALVVGLSKFFHRLARGRISIRTMRQEGWWP